MMNISNKKTKYLLMLIAHLWRKDFLEVAMISSSSLTIQSTILILRDEILLTHPLILILLKDFLLKFPSIMNSELTQEGNKE